MLMMVPKKIAPCQIIRLLFTFVFLVIVGLTKLTFSAGLLHTGYGHQQTAADFLEIAGAG